MCCTSAETFRLAVFCEQWASLVLRIVGSANDKPAPAEADELGAVLAAGAAAGRRFDQTHQEPAYHASMNGASPCSLDSIAGASQQGIEMRKVVGA